MSEADRYTLVQRLLHWLLALLVIPALGVGLTLGWLGFDGTKDAFGGEVTDALYTGHKTMGVLILALMTLRLVMRLTLGAPPPVPTLTGFERLASQAVHALLYLVLLAQPIVGWLATAAGGYPVQLFAWTLPGLIAKDPALSEKLFQLHGVLGWTLLALLALHIGAALMHWLVKRDGVMRRMSLFS
ncbi:MAG: cytochrome b [Chromatiaceae bacterium]